MPDPIPPLLGLRCLVIGGARGIGRAIVTRIAVDGAHCHATSRRPAERTLPTHRHAEYDVSWSRGDVREPADIDRMVDEAVSTLGGLDALVYCAGTAAVGPIDQLTPPIWDEVYQTNTRGFALAVQSALPHWRTNGHGCAVVLSSQAASRGQPLISAYSASKAALDGLVRALAIELAPHVRLNAVAPGIVLTNMIKDDFTRQAALADTSAGDIEQRTLARIPLRRFQTADSVAAAVAYLISPAAQHITGQVLAVDGGMSA